MTARYCLSGYNAAEPKLRWMFAVSLAVHCLLLLTLLGVPPDSSKKIYFSPVYSVDLIDLPPQPAVSTKISGGKSTTVLQHAATPAASRAKTLNGRTHTILTVSKKQESRANTAAKRQSASGDGRQASDAREGGTSRKAGTSEENGSAASPGDIRFARYYSAVWKKIKQAWVLPDYGVRSRSLEAIVVITIGRDGTILKSAFEKKSGNRGLDRSVMRAIKKVGRLPPLPPGFRQETLEMGIRFIPEE